MLVNLLGNLNAYLAVFPHARKLFAQSDIVTALGSNEDYVLLSIL